MTAVSLISHGRSGMSVIARVATAFVTLITSTQQWGGTLTMDPQTGDPILADGGELGSVSIFIDGRARGGSDAGDVTCAAHAKVREYYDQFPARRFHVHAADSHRVRVVTHFCSPDGTMSKTTERMVVR